MIYLLTKALTKPTFSFQEHEFRDIDHCLAACGLLFFLNQFLQFQQDFQGPRRGSHDHFQRPKLAGVELAISTLHGDFSSWCLLHGVNVKDLKQFHILSSKHAGYTHNQSYWSSSGRTSPGPAALQSQARSGEVPRQGPQPWPRAVCPGTEHCLSKDAERPITQYSSCALGLQILKQNPSSC